jgi:hypothetical protein
LKFWRTRTGVERQTNHADQHKAEAIAGADLIDADLFILYCIRTPISRPAPQLPHCVFRICEHP